MDLFTFDYHLREELIPAAHQPRFSRMLVVHGAEGRWEDRALGDLPQYLHRGACSPDL